MGEIDGVRALLTGRPRPVGWPARRARIEEVAAVDAPPADIVFTPTSIGGVAAEWSAAPGVDAARVLLFLHGGGYCSGSIVSHRTMASRAGAAAGMRALALAYRLAPEHPYPAALEDARAALAALLAQGFAPADIAVGGDSAGGGLSLALMVAQRDAGLPLPGCAWLASPWVDLAMTGASMDAKDGVDPLIHRGYLAELSAAYRGGVAADDPRVSPLHADLRGLPPVLVQVGSAETLLDDAVRIAGRLGAADVPVRLEVWPHMIHAWPLWSARLAEGRRALASAGAFLRARGIPEAATTA
ncbi:alpha/beta hydrolase fold domain-containing protein [Roseomonas sp. CECT 9278]|uniref:alpha/beta hydrolase fold domain-containing protein n=1 Tax=Roseomonas sp. CECT 9278 TaxID=2845823 RepID=UPI001E4FF211|nr:alpha/beta hydrolase fold domain-containing protein [Roseomonas sp. CECT 9278]CAH0271675.1 Monoterpene epsilon-lactone hydrolase [Roseomonas sp. CECT 9278]